LNIMDVVASPSSAAAVVGAVVITGAAILLQWLMGRAGGSRDGDGGAAVVPRGAARGEVHLRRKVQHAASGALIAVGLALLPRPAALAALLAFLALYAALHAARGASPAVHRAYLRALGAVLRSHEVPAGAIPGAVWFVAGTAVCVYCFDPPIALLSLGFLSLGDPIASYVGVSYGRSAPCLRRVAAPSGKTAAGSLGCFVACAAVGAAWAICGGGAGTVAARAHLAPFVGLCGVIGAAAEMAPLRLDDNLTIPILSGALLHFAVPADWWHGSG
jgi:diacylglycerol kinase (CTP)